MKSRKTDLFIHGVRDTVPLVIGALPFGIIFGSLATLNGLSFMATIAMSAFVFAGSAQFIAIGLLGSGAALPIILLTTFIVNLRHLLYSASLVPHVKHLAQIWRMPFAFWLTDETFAVTIKRFDNNPRMTDKQWYYLGSALVMYLNWQFCTFIGLTAGQAFPGIADWGLDFAMPVTFIGMLMPYLINKPMVIAVLVAGATALLSNSLPHKLGLMLAAFSGITAGLTLELLIKRKDSER